MADERREIGTGRFTRRTMLTATAFAAGAFALGCDGKESKGNPEMTYRKLGKTGLEVSEIGFGAEWMVRHDQAELYRLCAAKGVGITVMKAYADGRLLDAARSPFRTALTPVQCLHYALTRPAVASVLVGYDTPEHVDEAAGYEKSTAAERDYATVLAHAPRHKFDGECTYCDHCAPCSAGIPIGTVNMLYDLAASQATIPDSVREHHASLRRHAGDCTSCGVCERRCPFHVKVADRMRQAAKFFGF